MSYNGWKNYETWNVALWVGNDEPVYRGMRSTRPFTAKRAEIFVRDMYPSGTPDFADRGKSKAYKLVDWRAIADCFNDS